jgi:2-polyprenyl-6-methoxyphenol hydroxylase-like FAD-dependent oxidoreductase
MAHRGGHAIVIGASIGGLLAARAVAEHFYRVTIVERDELPEVPEPRKGVPQGQHTHALHARGREGLEQLFPGLTEELLAEGAVRGDGSADFIWYSHGSCLCNAPSGLIGLLMSRPLLENGVRRQLLRLPNICLRQRCEVGALIFDHGGCRVAGVCVRSRDRAEGVETMAADLVVDATGRGSRCAMWLNGFGYPAPREEKFEVGFGYTTGAIEREAWCHSRGLPPGLAGRRHCGAGGRALDREPWRLSRRPCANGRGRFSRIREKSPKAGHLSGHPGGGEAISANVLPVRHELAPALRRAGLVPGRSSGLR